MITKHTIPTGVATKVLDAISRRGYSLLNYTTDVTFYYATDGSSDVTISSGLKPGKELLPGQSVTVEDRPNLAVYVIQASGSDASLTTHDE